MGLKSCFARMTYSGSKELPDTECSSDLFGFGPVERRAVVASFDGGAITSDAGALLLGATNRAIRLVDPVRSALPGCPCRGSYRAAGRHAGGAAGVWSGAWRSLSSGRRSRTGGKLGRALSGEGRFFHGSCSGYCCLPLYVFCGCHLLAAKLRAQHRRGLDVLKPVY